MDRCYRCQEYDHYANECPNAFTSDSEGHESDNAALQIWPQIWNQMICKILIDIWKIHNI